jgi:citronellyl-CoA dehydrogenase
MVQLTEQHHAIKHTVARFVDQQINPYVEAWEREEQFPSHELFRELGKLGLLGIHYPEAYGGLGLDYSYVTVFAEELGRIACAGIPLAIGVQASMCTPALARFGSDELRDEYLAPSIRGELVGCLAVSEPGAGSDVASLKTSARREGDDYVISGSKLWITNGMQADWCCLLANTADGQVHRNKSLIVVPLESRGVQRQKIDKIGMHASDTAQLFFDDVRVPRRNLIGQEGEGFVMQMLQFQEERLWVAASWLKMLDGAIDQTIAYTRERQAFGKPILDNQVVHFRLAELRTELEALRSLTYRAVDDHISGQDVTRLASMAKLKCGRLIREVADACLQYWGGMGYTRDNPVARVFRDGRIVSIGGGADEIMLGVIARLEGTSPRKR